MEQSNMKVLVVDVGGTHVKVARSGRRERVKLDSSPTMTASQMAEVVRREIAGWEYDVVSIGYPGPVNHGRPRQEPHNLGGGWVRFDFAKAFGKPVRLINDAAMQALGSYAGGRMLFLGLGTGLGSAAISDGQLQPLELAHLPYRNGRTFEDYVGKRGLQRLGRAKWERHVHTAVELLRKALQADYVVLGGGNVHHLRSLPPHARSGSNTNAITGGIRLWDPKARAVASDRAPR